MPERSSRLAFTLAPRRAARCLAPQNTQTIARTGHCTQRYVIDVTANRLLVKLSPGVPTDTEATEMTNDSGELTQAELDALEAEAQTEVKSQMEELGYAKEDVDVNRVREIRQAAATAKARKELAATAREALVESGELSADEVGNDEYGKPILSDEVILSYAKIVTTADERRLAADAKALEEDPERAMALRSHELEVQDLINRWRWLDPSIRNEQAKRLNIDPAKIEALAGHKIHNF